HGTGVPVRAPRPHGLSGGPALPGPVGLPGRLGRVGTPGADQPARPIPAAFGQPVAGTDSRPSVPRTWAAVRPPRAGTPGGVGPNGGGYAAAAAGAGTGAGAGCG